MKLVVFLCLFTMSISAQVTFEIIDTISVKYQKRNSNDTLYNFNPLHVSDIWQYEDDKGKIHETIIDRDTVVNSKTYFHKKDFLSGLFTWERIDTLTGVSYLLDVDDLDEDSNYDEELLLDSLDVPDQTRVACYRYCWKESPWDEMIPGETLVYYELIVVVFGDTVHAKSVQYTDRFVNQIIADKYGVLRTTYESPPYLITGAKIDGKEYGTIVSVFKNKDVIMEFTLGNNYPNPFNPTTTIEFSIPENGHVKLQVFNLLGELIELLVDNYKESGTHTVSFNGNDYSSGVYLYRLSFENYLITKKMLLLK